MTIQTELTEWEYIFYADISGQLKRLGLGAGYFDGLLLKKDSHAGCWLQQELVKPGTYVIQRRANTLTLEDQIYRVRKQT